MSFQIQLRKARENAGLSIPKAAAMAGVSARTWAYWEDGDRLPPKEAEAITQERLLAMMAKPVAGGS